MMEKSGLIRASLNSLSYGDVMCQLAHGDGIVEIGLWLHVSYWHFVGSRGGSGIVLSRAHERRLSWCGDTLGQSAHLAVGAFVENNIYSSRGVLMDCGVPILASRTRLPFPDGRSHDAKGKWLAAIGDLHVTCRPAPTIPFEVIGMTVVDLDIASTGFGKIIPWKIGSTLPHDPDVMCMPCAFMDLKPVL